MDQGPWAIVPLEPRHVPALVRRYQGDPPGYSRYFTPFSFDEATWREILAARRDDLYFAIERGGEVAGYYMLRGWDAGYAIPAYGVWVAHPFQGQGLATATLHHAVARCRERGSETLMLKVHPDNHGAKALYERFGFQQVGSDPRNDNLIYHLDLQQAAARRNG